MFMPDMRRNVYDPGLILFYAEQDRGAPVYDQFPERVQSAAARADREMDEAFRRRMTPPSESLLDRTRSAVHRWFR